MIQPVTPGDYLLLRLAALGDGRRTAQQLASDARGRLPKAVTGAALRELDALGLATLAPRVSLTEAGQRRVRERFGPDVPQGPARFERRVEPALSLGIPPGGALAERLARPEALRGILLNRLYQLGLDDHEATQAQAMSVLVQRALSGGAGRSIGAGAGLGALGLRPGEDLTDLERLRHALIRVALALGCEEDQPAPATGVSQAPPPRSPGPGASRTAGNGNGKGHGNGARQAGADEADGGSCTGFADRLGTMLDDFTFARRVTAVSGRAPAASSIASVYDAYHERFDDAGTLEAFKARLLAAAHAGHLSLQPLAEFTALDDATRQRSEIVTPTSRLHLVAVGPGKDVR